MEMVKFFMSVRGVEPWQKWLMKPRPEMIEGPEAFKRFDATVKAIMAVPHSEIMRREAEYKKQSNANPRKRGPKPKGKPLAG